jgi:phosphatidate cytidylyltransferase
MAAPAEPIPKRASSLTLRILSAAVLIPIVGLAAYLGSPWWDLLVVLFGAVMIWEWSRIAAKSRAVSDRISLLIARVSVVLVVLVLLGSAFPSASPALRLALEAPRSVLFASVLVMLLALPFYGVAALWFGLGMVYVTVPCIALISMRGNEPFGLIEIIWLVSLVIAADTCAYIAGRSIGGPKLAPRISPNKTWAGLGGAIVGAAIVGAITSIWMGSAVIQIWLAIGGCAALAIVEQAGDLAESAFKRHFGVKDSGRIIPGHGGALDRVDGLMAVATAVAIIEFFLSRGSVN